MEEGNHVGTYALKTAIFDIIKYLFQVDANMTEEELQQAHQNILDLYEDVLSENSTLEILIKNKNANEKIIRQHQYARMILLEFVDLIENAKK